MGRGPADEASEPQVSPTCAACGGELGARSDAPAKCEGEDDARDGEDREDGHDRVVAEDNVVWRCGLRMGEGLGRQQRPSRARR